MTRRTLSLGTSDTEVAQAAARDPIRMLLQEARGEQALTEQVKDETLTGEERLAVAALRSALEGVVPNPDDLISDLNLAHFVEDGVPSPERIKKLTGRMASMNRPPPPDLGGNSRLTRGSSTRSAQRRL